jgi:hypothetical protein
MGEMTLMKKSKPIIHDMTGATSPVENCVLARHYGSIDEELDFIINYDIKYHMGRDSGGDD